jgi:hypothetical protein
VNRATSAVVLVVAVVALAGCASNTNGTGSTAGAPPRSSTPRFPSTSKAASAPDHSALAAVVLTSADVPSDWTGSPSSNNDTPGPDSHQAQLAACIGIPDSSPQQVAVADSEDFDKDNSTISSSATSYKSQTAITSDTRGIVNPKAPDCFARALQSGMATQLPNGATTSDFKVTLVPGANGGPSAVVGMIHASFVVHTSGVAVPFYIDSALIAGKLVEAEVDFFGFQTPIAASIQRTAIDAVARRVAAI